MPPAEVSGWVGPNHDEALSSAAIWGYRRCLASSSARRPVRGMGVSTVSQFFEPETLYCTAGECLQEARTSGYATFEVGPLAGVADHERLLTFTLPLCPNHAELLSAGRVVEFKGRALHRDSA